MSTGPDSSAVAAQLREHGIQPSAQRVAVARYVLFTTDHPTADRVWDEVKRDFPVISRATVYNTLNLFVDRGLLHCPAIDDSAAVFDANTTRHHHFVDRDTGRVIDIPQERLAVEGVEGLEGLDVEDVSVVLRGRLRNADEG